MYQIVASVKKVFSVSLACPDPFFCHLKEKRKKAVWPRETNSLYACINDTKHNNDLSY